MLTTWRKICSLIILSTFMVLGSHVAYGEGLSDVEPKSIEEFGKNLKYGSQTLTDVLKTLGSENEGHPCGTIDNICSGNQTCWKCTTSQTVYRGGMNAYSVTYDSYEGRCFDKSKSKDAIKNEWCKGGTLSAAPEGFQGSSTTSAVGVVTTSNKEYIFTDGTHSYILILDGKNAALAYGDSGEITRGCEVLPIKIYNMSGCFFCPLSKVVFEAADEIASMSFSAFGNVLRKLLVIAFAIWLAFASLQIVFTYTKQDGNKYLSSILLQGGKFLFAYILLSNPSDIFNFFITPVLTAGIDMAEGIAALPNVEPTNYTPSVLSSQTMFNSGGLYTKIEYFLASVQSQLAAMQAIGSSLFCVGGHQMIDGGIVNTIFNFKSNLRNGLHMLTLGLILFIFAFLLTISFAFYFLDALLQLAIIGAMMPLMIAGWPFKLTASYATSGFQMVMNTFFTIFFTGFVVSTEITLIDKTLIEVGGGESSTASGLGGLFNAINEQNEDEIQKLTDIGIGGFLLLVFAGLFGFKFVKEVPKLAGKLAEGAQLGIAPKIGTMGASAATGAAKKVTSAVGGQISKKWDQVGGVTGIIGSAIKKTGDSRLLRNTKFGQKLSSTGGNISNFAKNTHAIRRENEEMTSAFERWSANEQAHGRSGNRKDFNKVWNQHKQEMRASNEAYLERAKMKEYQRKGYTEEEAKQKIAKSKENGDFSREAERRYRNSSRADDFIDFNTKERSAGRSGSTQSYMDRQRWNEREEIKGNKASDKRWNKYQEVKQHAREEIGVTNNEQGVDKLAERAKAMENMTAEERAAYRREQLRNFKKNRK